MAQSTKRRAPQLEIEDVGDDAGVGLEQGTRGRVIPSADDRGAAGLAGNWPRELQRACLRLSRPAPTTHAEPRGLLELFGVADISIS